MVSECELRPFRHSETNFRQAFRAAYDERSISDPLLPEKRLIRAVISRAICDALGWEMRDAIEFEPWEIRSCLCGCACGMLSPLDDWCRESAASWFSSDDPSLFSFKWCVETLMELEGEK
jgi:hypothetical protein